MAVRVRRKGSVEVLAKQEELKKERHAQYHLKSQGKLSDLQQATTQLAKAHQELSLALQEEAEERAKTERLRRELKEAEERVRKLRAAVD